MTVVAWLIAIPAAVFALTFWLCILAAAALGARAVLRPRLEVRRGLRDLERDLAERGES